MITKFSADTEDLVRVLSQIKRLQKKYFEKGICKIRVMSGGIELSSIGMFLCVHAETDHECEVFAPLKLLHVFALECKTPTIQFTFKDGFMQCGSVIYETPQIKVQYWMEQPTFDFSINYTDLELLKLFLTEGDGRITDPSMQSQLRSAKMKMSKSITEAYGSLSNFSVSKEDVALLVKKKIIGQ
jgi:hypothetical protein